MSVYYVIIFLVYLRVLYIFLYLRWIFIINKVINYKEILNYKNRLLFILNVLKEILRKEEGYGVYLIGFKLFFYCCLGLDFGGIRIFN